MSSPLALFFSILFFATCFCHLIQESRAENQNLLKTNKHNLIFTSFPFDKFGEYYYKFSGTFEDERLRMLALLSGENGSTQSNDALEYDEYVVLTDPKRTEELTQQYEKAVEELGKTRPKLEKYMKDNGLLDFEPFSVVVDKFEKSVESFNEKLENFIKTYPRVTYVWQFGEGHNSENDETQFNEQLNQEKELFKKTQQRQSKRISSRSRQQQSDISSRFAEDELPLHNLVIRCKQFMRSIMSEGGEGSWIDIFSFMESGEGNYKYFKNIFEISKSQSELLDEMINEAIWQEHLANRNKQERTRNPFERAVIEGAGPIGLYASLQLFLAGMRVLIVNERPEQYQRFQAFFFDTKWMTQFRFLLGTKFDELFVGEEALARINHVEVGQLNCKYFEETMKSRIKSLISHLELYHANEFEADTFRIVYEVAVQEILAPTSPDESFTVKMGVPKSQTHPQLAEFNQNLVDIEARKLMASNRDLKNKNPQKEGEKKVIRLLRKNIQNHLIKEKGIDAKKIFINKPVIEFYSAKNAPREMISVKELANRQFRGKALKLNKLPENAPVDLVICAGGANDRIRKKYLGDIRQETIPKNYGICVFEKGIINEVIFDDVNLFDTIPMAEMRIYLEAQRFDNLLAEYGHKLDEVLREYKIRITESPVNYNKVVDTFVEDNGGNGLFVRLFENNKTVHIATITPPAVVKFVNKVNELKSGKPWEEQEAYDQFLNRFHRKWHTAMFYMFIQMKHPHKKIRVNIDEHGNPGIFSKSPGVLNFDPNPINCTTFDLIIKSVKNTVAESRIGQSSVVVAAVGDANTSPHFMTSSGLSTGRIGVENIAQLIRQYHNAESAIFDEEELIEEMRIQLSTIRHRVLKKVLEYVDIKTDDDGLKSAKEKGAIQQQPIQTAADHSMTMGPRMRESGEEEREDWAAEGSSRNYG